MACDRLESSDRFCFHPGLPFQEIMLLSLCGNSTQGLGRGNRDFMPQFNVSLRQLYRLGVAPGVALGK